MHAIATVTSKGQVTLPRKVRAFLKTRSVEFEVADDAVLLRPVHSVAGSLSKYAKDYHALRSMREKVWKEAVRDKAENSPA